MKRIIVLVLALAAAFSIHAQDKGNIEEGVYAMPEFTQGVAALADGTMKGGKFNICTVDQTVRFMSNDGEILVMDGTDDVVRLSAGKKLFYRNGRNFVELIDMFNDVYLGRECHTILLNNAKTGAYGTVSNTSSIESYTRNDSDGMYYTSVDTTQKDNIINEVVFSLYKNGKFMNFSKKGLIKCFPDRKAFIEEYFSTHDVGIRDREAVTALFEALKAK